MPTCPPGPGFEIFGPGSDLWTPLAWQPGTPQFKAGFSLGLARLTLLLPSGRAVRTVTEAFIRHSGSGLLMPRMAVVGDLDLDETIGPLLDPLGTADIPPAADQKSPVRELPDAFIA